MLRRDFVKLPALAVLPVSLPEISKGETIELISMSYVHITNQPIDKQRAKLYWDELLDKALAKYIPSPGWLPIVRFGCIPGFFVLQIIKTNKAFAYVYHQHIFDLQTVGLACFKERDVQ